MEESQGIRYQLSEYVEVNQVEVDEDSSLNINSSNSSSAHPFWDKAVGASSPQAAGIKFLLPPPTLSTSQVTQGLTMSGIQST